MMHLPNFTEPNPTKEFLRTEQNRLVVKADELITQTGIMEIFKKYGEFSGVGGSYAYRLMMLPDLDIGITTPQVNKNVFCSLLGEIAASNYVRKISTVDTVHFPPASHADKRPKGYWLGIEIPYDNDRWGIDCWLQQTDWRDEKKDIYSDRLMTIDENQRDAILAVKYELIRTKKYGGEFISSHVYDAVLDGGVRDIDGFNQWAQSLVESS